MKRVVDPVFPHVICFIKYGIAPFGDIRGVNCLSSSLGGSPGPTPPKHYNHKLINVFGLWECQVCKKTHKSEDKMLAIPCNAEYTEKLAEVDSNLNLVL